MVVVVIKFLHQHVLFLERRAHSTEQKPDLRLEALARLGREFHQRASTGMTLKSEPFLLVDSLQSGVCMKAQKRVSISDLYARVHDWRAVEDARCEMLAVLRSVEESGMSLVNLHKERLGKQSRTVTENRARYWVWEDEAWAVKVSNKKGIRFELVSGTPVGEARIAWRSYLTKIQTQPTVDLLLKFFSGIEPGKVYTPGELVNVTGGTQASTFRAFEKLAERGRLEKVGQERWVVR